MILNYFPLDWSYKSFTFHSLKIHMFQGDNRFVWRSLNNSHNFFEKMSVKILFEIWHQQPFSNLKFSKVYNNLNLYTLKVVFPRHIQFSREGKLFIRQAELILLLLYYCKLRVFLRFRFGDKKSLPRALNV